MACQGRQYQGRRHPLGLLSFLFVVRFPRVLPLLRCLLPRLVIFFLYSVGFPFLSSPRGPSLPWSI
jgi:hypothetical protein